MHAVDFAAEILPTAQTPVDRAYHYIAGLIDLKRIPTGGLLPRAEVLARQAGVSRPTVLAALSLLQEHGLVRVGTGRAGVRVVEQVGANKDARVAWVYEHRDAIGEMATLRTILEPGLMRLAAQHGLSPDLRAEAAERHEQMCHGTLDHQGYLAADTEFHAILAAGIGAKSLERMSLLVRRWVAPAIDLVPWPPNRREASNTEHAALLAALDARDPDAAEDAALQYVTFTTQRIHDLLAGMDTASSHGGSGTRRKTRNRSS